MIALLNRFECGHLSITQRAIHGSAFLYIYSCDADTTGSAKIFLNRRCGLYYRPFYFVRRTQFVELPYCGNSA